MRARGFSGSAGSPDQHLEPTTPARAPRPGTPGRTNGGWVADSSMPAMRTRTVSPRPPVTDHPVAISRELVVHARRGLADGAARPALADLQPDALAHALADDPSRTAFWLNIYNGAVRARLLAEPEAYSRRWQFFMEPAITVAGRPLSPNAIEHGLLRRSALLGGLGYLRNPFPPAYERMLRVARPDPRIHFALNCGARSCPPLVTWDASTLDADLEQATRAYLAGETRWLDGGRLLLPRLLLWYRGDFGGRRGIRALLERHGLVEAGGSLRVRYGSYDWTLDLDDPAG
jgi:hypothetical protein